MDWPTEPAAPFTAAGKPVLHVEYSGALSSFCPTTKALGFSSLKKLDLDAWPAARDGGGMADIGRTAIASVAMDPARDRGPPGLE